MPNPYIVPKRKRIIPRGITYHTILFSRGVIAGVTKENRIYSSSGMDASNARDKERSTVRPVSWNGEVVAIVTPGVRKKIRKYLSMCGEKNNPHANTRQKKIVNRYKLVLILSK